MTSPYTIHQTFLCSLFLLLFFLPPQRPLPFLRMNCPKYVSDSKVSSFQRLTPLFCFIYFSCFGVFSVSTGLVSCQSIHFHQFNEYIYPSGFILLRVILLFPVDLFSRHIPLAFKLNRSEKEKSIFFLTFNLDLLPSFPLNNIFMALVP